VNAARLDAAMDVASNAAFLGGGTADGTSGYAGVGWAVLIGILGVGNTRAQEFVQVGVIGIAVADVCTAQAAQLRATGRRACGMAIAGTAARRATAGVFRTIKGRSRGTGRNLTGT
jgi:hypothetical protein